MAKPHRGAPGALSWAPHRPEPQPDCPVFLWAPHPGGASRPLPRPRELQLCCPGRGSEAQRPRGRRNVNVEACEPEADLRERLRARARPPASPPSSSQSPSVRKGNADVERAAKPSLGPAAGGGSLPPLVFFLLLSFQALLTSPGPGPPHPAPAVLAPSAGPAASPAVVPDRADEKARALGAPRAGGLPGRSLPDGAPPAGARFRSRGTLA